jgi:L-malate glycosyltransferase
MNIGIISTVGGQYSWAGSEETWRMFAIHAQKQGHQLSVMLPFSIASASQVDEVKSRGAKVYIRDELNPLTRKLADKGMHSRFKSFFAVPHDVLFVSMGGISDCAWIPDLKQALLRSRTPIVYFIQANAEGAIAAEPIRQSLRCLYKAATEIIFLSQHNQKLAERQLAWKPESAQIVMNPIREAMEKPLPWPLNDGDPFKLAEVARFEVVDKQQDHLLEALSSPEWKQRNWALTFFGSGADEPHIRRLIEFYGLKRKVKIGGFVSSFREIWKDHHLHVLPSRREGMPLALIESMACGRPALVTRAGGSPELINEGISGFICPGMHPEILQETLERAWAKRNQWQQMGQAASAKIQAVVPKDWGNRILNIVESAANRSHL